jgi:hypothetical protein
LMREVGGVVLQEGSQLLRWLAAGADVPHCACPAIAAVERSGAGERGRI